MNETVSLLIDDIALHEDDGVFDFNESGVTYEQVKETVIEKVSAAIASVMKDRELTTEQKMVTMISTYSYATIQNFILWHTILKERSKK